MIEFIILILKHQESTYFKIKIYENGVILIKIKFFIQNLHDPLNVLEHNLCRPYKCYIMCPIAKTVTNFCFVGILSECLLFGLDS